MNIVADELNSTGDGTDHGIGSVTATTSLVDRNADMTDGDGGGTAATWTAPVTGIYTFTYSLQLVAAVASGSDESIVFITTTARSYRLSNLPTRERIAAFGGVNLQVGVSGIAIANMTASDTATFRVQINNGTKTSSLNAIQINVHLIA